jgi:hypothetical protein
MIQATEKIASKPGVSLVEVVDSVVLAGTVWQELYKS